MKRRGFFGAAAGAVLGALGIVKLAKPAPTMKCAGRADVGMRDLRMDNVSREGTILMCASPPNEPGRFVIRRGGRWEPLDLNDWGSGTHTHSLQPEVRRSGDHTHTI